LHTKFLPDVCRRAAIEKQRGEHFADATQYAPYYDALHEGPDFWCPDAMRYTGAAQLENLGIMRRAGLTYD
jgi:hypothetical protein